MAIFLFVLAVWAMIVALGDYRERDAIGATECEIIAALFFIGCAIVRAIDKVGLTLKEVKSADQKSEKSKERTDAIPAKPKERPTLKYFFSLNGMDCGPYSLEAMRTCYAAGKITHETLAFREGDKDWHPLGHYPEIYTKNE